MTARISRDLDDLIRQINWIARHWLGPMPPDCGHMDPIAERLDGFIHSLLVNLEGGGGVEPHRLSPKGRPDLDLAAEAPHEVWSSTSPVDPPELEALFVALRSLVAKHAARNVERAEAMLGLVCDVTHHLVDGYELVPLVCDDDTGEVVAEGADLAAGLAAADPEGWNLR